MIKKKRERLSSLFFAVNGSGCAIPIKIEYFQDIMSIRTWYNITAFCRFELFAIVDPFPVVKHCGDTCEYFESLCPTEQKVPLNILGIRTAQYH